MLKRILLTLTSAAALTAAVFFVTGNVNAQWRYGGPYTSYYYGAPVYDNGYYSPYSYRSSYAPQYYQPQTYYYAPQPYYRTYYAPGYYQPVPQVAWRDGWLR